MNPSIEMSWIKDRCIEVGECWEWQRGKSSAGYPMIRRLGKTYLVRRIVMDNAGKPAAPRQPVACRCDNPRCLNPEHLFLSSTSAICKRAGARGVWSTLGRAAKISASKRRTTAKLTDEAVAAIRASDETQVVLSKRYGINASLVGRVKRGDAWKDYTSPFAGLGAR
jgi:hypothetical protein